MPQIHIHLDRSKKQTLLGKAAKSVASTVAKVGRAASAAARWIAAGSPQRSPEQITYIFSAHCQPCNKFIPGDTQRSFGACSLCSCKLTGDNSAMINKIRMATESCPIGKWQADVVVPDQGQE